MYTKEWYKKAWQREKKRASWYETAYKCQNASRKELEREVNELKSVLHVANAALKLKKGEKNGR